MAVLTESKFGPRDAAAILAEQTDQRLALAATVMHNPGGNEQIVGSGYVLNVTAPTIGMAREIDHGGKITAAHNHSVTTQIKLGKITVDRREVTDADFTLAISNFAVQVLNPISARMANKLEEKIASTMTGNTPGFAITTTKAKLVESIGTAVGILGSSYVPMDDLFVAVNPRLGTLLAADPAVRQGTPYSESALATAVVGQLYGATVVQSPYIPANKVFVYHRTAYVLATRTPSSANPNSADTWEKSIIFGGTTRKIALAMRYDRSSDEFAEYITAAVMVGTGAVKDAGKIDGSAADAVFTPFDGVADEATHGQPQFIRAVAITVSS